MNSKKTELSYTKDAVSIGGSPAFMDTCLWVFCQLISSPFQMPKRPMPRRAPDQTITLRSREGKRSQSTINVSSMSTVSPRRRHDRSNSLSRDERDRSPAFQLSVSSHGIGVT